MIYTFSQRGSQQIYTKSFASFKNLRTESRWKDSGGQGAETCEAERSVQKKRLYTCIYYILKLVIFQWSTGTTRFHHFILGPCTSPFPPVAHLLVQQIMWQVCEATDWLPACLSVWCHWSERYQQHHTALIHWKQMCSNSSRHPRKRNCSRSDKLCLRVCVCACVSQKRKLSEGGLNASVFNFSRGFFCVRY